VKSTFNVQDKIKENLFFSSFFKNLLVHWKVHAANADLGALAEAFASIKTLFE
jgi:hypothetical protein